MKESVRILRFAIVGSSNALITALETAKELVEKSLKDNGCIAYDIFESSTRSDVLMI